MPSRRGWEPPEVFDEYRLIRSIGRGGMGQVYLGHDVLLDRPVAVKFIAAVEPDAQARQRFLIEARAIARLAHPNVVAIYRVGEVSGRPFLVSEFVRGTSLSRIPKPIPWPQVLRIGLGLARGLGAAHRQGVLHRDIKPANVILTDEGEVKLLDFGLAKLVSLLPLAAGEPEETLGLRDRPAASALHPTVGRTRAAAGLLGGRSHATQGKALAARQVAVPAATALSLDSPIAPPSAGSLPVKDPKTPAPPPTPVASHSPPMPSLPLSSVGSVIGTPLYMAPEALSGQPATRFSDVYSLGAVLYELCTGRPPRQSATSAQSTSPTQSGPPVSEPPPDVEPVPLEQAVPGIEARFAQVVDRCLRLLPEERYPSGDELRDALEQLLPQAHSPVIPLGNPYRGLLAFEAEHRDLFFGRGPEVRALIDRLRTEPLLLVAGDSGVGKSSLCRAGVLPLVTDGALEEGRTYVSLRLLPGKHPLAALTAVLGPWLGVPEEALRRKLEGEPAAVIRALRRRQGPQAGTLLFIDQTEELVTQSDAEEAKHFGLFLGALGTAVPGIRVLMTARSDFLGRLALLPGLGDELLRILYILRPLSPEGIREAIVGPAQQKGVTFESDELVSALVHTATEAPGGLPLLQFALAELWEGRDQTQQVISAAALQAIGGAPRALARYADGVLAGLTPEQGQAARRVLTRLVTPGGTRTRRTQTELGRNDVSTQAVLEALVRSRLLVASQTEGTTVYEVAHEALLQGWDTLRHWLEADLDDRALRLRLEAAAADWERHDRAVDLLWGERQVREASRLDRDDLHETEVAFLHAAQGRLRRQRLVRTGTLGAVPMLVLLILVSVRVSTMNSQRRKLEDLMRPAQEALREARTAGAQAQAERQRAIALFDQSAETDEAELEYAAALALDRKADAAYRRASGHLETALLLDVGHADARAQALLGDATYERIELAERLHRDDLRAELVQRLDSFDQDGSRRRKLRRLAHVHVQTTPPGGHLTVERYDGDLRRAQSLRTMELAGGADLSLEAGSYLLVFRTSGRAEVRLPVLLHAGEALDLPVLLPSVGSVPPGYVYVPEGRFLFGSADDDGLRKSFLHAQPLHETRTGAYLISRTEVTFADWLAYLRALPPQDRELRLPHVSEIFGGLRLTGTPESGFVLQLQPNNESYKVREGEPFHYQNRPQRQLQNWLRFPVAGVSYDDARGYVAWLDRTGRVPGARLCNEHEWERAARGADGRPHPHGMVLAPDDANFDQTYKQDLGPDEVGSHPVSASPFGVLDMSGNVWEWTSTVTFPERAVLRGGAWQQGEVTNRSANREVVQNTFRGIMIGLRVCATPRNPG